MRSISSCCLCTKEFKQGAWFHRGNESVNKKNIVLIQCNLVLSFISFAYFVEKWRHSPETVVSRLWNYIRIHLSTLTKISVLQQRALLTGNVDGYFFWGVTVFWQHIWAHCLLYDLTCELFNVYVEWRLSLVFKQIL